MQCEHRIVQLEGTYKADLIQLPDHLRANQKLKHTTGGIIPKPPEHRQSWGISHLPRKPVAVFDHTPITSLAQLCAVPSHSTVSYQGAETSTSLPASPPQDL